MNQAARLKHIEIAQEASDVREFTTVVEYERHEDGQVLWVDWYLFEAAGQEIDGGRILYRADDTKDTRPPCELFTSDLWGKDGTFAAEVIASGHVKWDGCLEFRTHGGYHACDGPASLAPALDAIRHAARLASDKLTDPES